MTSVSSSKTSQKIGEIKNGGGLRKLATLQKNGRLFSVTLLVFLSPIHSRSLLT